MEDDPAAGDSVTDDENNSGGDGGGSADTPPVDPPAEAQASRPNQRSYRIYEQIKLPLSAKPADLLKILQDRYGKEGTIDVLVHISNVISGDPKKAVETLGEAKDLDGDYQSIADSSFNLFDNVKTTTKRHISFG